MDVFRVPVGRDDNGADRTASSHASRDDTRSNSAVITSASAYRAAQVRFCSDSFYFGKKEGFFAVAGRRSRLVQSGGREHLL